MVLAEDPGEKLAPLAVGSGLIKKFHNLVIKGLPAATPVSQAGFEPTAALHYCGALFIRYCCICRRVPLFLV